MPWLDVPPELRQPVTAAEVLTAVVTPLFGVALVVGPPAAAAGLITSGGNRVLTVVVMTVAMLWLVAIVREPTVLGLLLAAPYGWYALAQRARGKVHSADLEDGRWVPVAAREPTAAERAELDALDAPAPIEVIGECVCGCAGLRLLSRAPALPPGRDDFEVPSPGGERELRYRLGTPRSLERRPAAHPEARGGHPDG